MQTPGEVLKQFWTLVADQRTEDAIQLLDPEGVFWARPLGKVPMRGFIEILRGVQTVVPMTFTIHLEMEKGVHALMEMESHGQFQSGESYNNNYIWRADIRDGRIVELREYSDTAYANDVFARNLPPAVMATIAVHLK